MSASKEHLGELGLEETTLWTDWQRVDSSNIGAIRYNGLQQKMQVAFMNGYKYEYDDVEQSTFHNFLNAESKGQFFYYAIRQFGYSYRQV
jgi:hypothetical protein